MSSRTSKNKPAILPGKPSDPTGVDSIERKAMRDFNRRMREASKAYVAALERIPSGPAVNRRYEFRLDQVLLNALLAQLDLEIDAILLEGGANGIWLFEQYVSVAAARGVTQEFSNLAQQSPAYKSGRESAMAILRSEPHQRRMALVRARVFEEMKGLSGQVKASMARILTEGIGRGQNPRDIASQLKKQSAVESRRAHRIARTEITTALRRARWDEADDAEAIYGVKTKELHLSALSPTTRQTHAARHGKLFTREQVRDWWSRDGNSVNCKCTTTSVMVDDDGKPLVPSIIDRAKARK